MNTQNPKCLEIEPLLDVYHDSEATPAEALLVDDHLADCPSCQAKLFEITRVVSSLKGMPQLAPSRDIAADLDALFASSDIASSDPAHDLQPEPAQPAILQEIPKSPGVVREGNVIRPSVWSRPAVWGSIGIAAAAAILIFAARFMTAPTHQLATESQTPTNIATQPNATGPANAIGTEPSTQPSAASSLATTSGAPVNPSTPPTMPQSIAIQPSPVQPPVLPNSNSPDVSVPHSSPSATQNTIASNSPSVEENLPQQVTEQPTTIAYGSAYSGSGAIEVSNYDDSGDNSLLALYESQPITEELGISSDEDGLYAVKM
jgi:hypothetical protein